MIQQKKTYRFRDDTVITEQNIRQIGELIALNSVRTRMIHSTRDLYYVFQCLYKDIYCHTDNLKPYSEAYDYAEAYERYDKLIAKMALPDYEYETLLAMMNGMRNDRYETVFQCRLHHDLPPQTSYSEKIFTRRKHVTINPIKENSQ